MKVVPELPRPVWMVLGGDFISAIGSGLTMPCLFIYAHRVRDLSYGMAGLVVSVVALASLVGNPLGGALADRWTPRQALMAGAMVAASGSVGLALTHTVAGLVVAAAVLGLGIAVAWPAQDALLASLAGAARRSAVFSVRHACLNAGLGLGALVAAAVISVSRPATFVAVYLADAASYLALVVLLGRLGAPAASPGQPPEDREQRTPAPVPAGFRQVLRDRTFIRVWLFTAILVTVSFGQFQVGFPGYASRPGGVGPHGVALALAANTVTVVLAQLLVLRMLGGRRRTTAVALAAVAWSITWVVVVAAGHLGSGSTAEAAFIAAMVVFAIGECLLSPTLPAIINDVAAPGAAGRYNGLGTLAYTTGFLVGPVIGAAALGAGWGAGLFVVLAAACSVAAFAALGLGRLLPASANHIPVRDPEPPSERSPSSEDVRGPLIPAS